MVHGDSKSGLDELLSRQARGMLGGREWVFNSWVLLNSPTANTQCTDSREKAFDGSEPALVYGDGRVCKVSWLLGEETERGAHGARLGSVDQKLAYKLRLEQQHK